MDSSSEDVLGAATSPDRTVTFRPSMPSTNNSAKNARIETMDDDIADGLDGFVFRIREEPDTRRWKCAPFVPEHLRHRDDSEKGWRIHPFGSDTLGIPFTVGETAPRRKTPRVGSMGDLGKRLERAMEEDREQRRKANRSSDDHPSNNEHRDDDKHPHNDEHHSGDEHHAGDEHHNDDEHRTNEENSADEENRNNKEE